MYRNVLKILKQQLQNSCKRFLEDRFLRNVSLTSLCQVIGIVTGFALDAGILALFGLGQETDAYFAALAVPLVVTNTLEVQLPKVLVPLLTRDFQGPSRQAGEFLGQLLALATLLLGSLSLVSVLLGQYLITYQVPGLARETLEVAVEVAEIAFWLIALRAISTILRCRLYSRQRYALAASKKALVNAAALVVLLAFHVQWGIRAVAAGLALGEMLAIGTMLAALAWDDDWPSLAFRRLDPQVGRLGRLMLYPTASHLLGESKTLIENYLLSFLAGGAISSLRYASRIIQALSGVLVGGVMTTTLPMLARFSGQNRIEEMKSTLLRGMRLVAAAGVPVGICLVAASHSLLMLMYGRGEFTAADAALPAALVAWLTPYLILSRFSGLLQVPFMSVLELRTPFYSTVLSFLAHLGVLLALIGGLGIFAFPVAAVLSAALSTLFLTYAFLRRFGGVDWVPLKTFAGRVGLAGLLCAAGCGLGVALLELSVAQLPVPNLLRFAITVVLGTSTYLAGLWWSSLLVSDPAPESEGT